MTDEQAVEDVVHTADGVDVVRGCGCVERLDPDWDAWVVVSQCQPCANVSAKLDQNIPRLLDHELDVYVYEAAGGKRVDRIMPRDTTKRR